MLLRRITQHIKEQNWIAVCLDLIIVVFGVFLGIQFANWNDQRKDVLAEQVILKRLHAEVSNTIATDTQARELFLDARLNNLVSARRIIFDVSERKELNEQECQAIALSHFPFAAGRSVPVLRELRSTGETILIRDKHIVEKISVATDLLDTFSLFEEFNRPRITLLSKAFPELVTMQLNKEVGLVSDFEIDEYDPFYRCDSNAMRTNAEFRNAFGENATLQFLLLEACVKPLRKSLTELKNTLDQALGKQHEHE